MSAHVLLNKRNEEKRSNERLAEHFISFLHKFNKFNNTRA